MQSRAQRNKSAFTRVFEAFWRSVTSCRPGIVESDEFGTIPDQ
jgi:hypothetical protein